MTVVDSWNIVPMYALRTWAHESCRDDGQRLVLSVDQIVYPLTTSLRVDGALYVFPLSPERLDAPRVHFLHALLSERRSPTSYNCLRPKHHVCIEPAAIMVRCLNKQMAYGLMYHGGDMLKVGNAAGRRSDHLVCGSINRAFLSAGSVSVSHEGVRRRPDKRDVGCVVDRVTDHTRNWLTMSL